MVMTKDNSKTVRDPIVDVNQGNNDKNLLDLTPNDVVFYIGGYPSNFTVSSRKTHQ